MAAPVATGKPRWAIAAIVILTVLIFSPVDLLPEWFLGPLGLLDDLGYGILDIILLLYINHRQRQGALPGTPPLDSAKKVD